MEAQKKGNGEKAIFPRLRKPPLLTFHSLTFLLLFLSSSVPTLARLLHAPPLRACVSSLEMKPAAIPPHQGCEGAGETAIRSTRYGYCAGNCVSATTTLASSINTCLDIITY